MATMAGSAFPSCRNRNRTSRRRCLYLWILKSSPVFISSYTSKPAVICAFHNRSRRNKTTTSTPDRMTSCIHEVAIHDEKEVDCDCCWCCGGHAGSVAGLCEHLWSRRRVRGYHGRRCRLLRHQPVQQLHQYRFQGRT